MSSVGQGNVNSQSLLSEDYKVKFILALENIYRQFSTIERLFEGASVPMDEAFVNIAVVTSEEQCEKEKALKNKTNTKINEEVATRYRSGEGDLGLYETIYLPKKEIRLNQLFVLNKATQETTSSTSTYAKHLVIEGRAGIGKSTLAKFLAYQWSKRTECVNDTTLQSLRQQLDTNFSGVVKISLRELNRYPITQEISLSSFLCLHYGLSSKDTQIMDEVIKKDEQSQKPLLYILDGWDELDPSMWTENSPRSHLLKNLIDKTAWLMTSRPGQVPQEIKKDAYLELLGFNSDNVERYINIFFKDSDNLERTLINRLLMFVKRPMIAGMAHIPINLELLCCAWKDRYERLITEEELSLAELYYEIVVNLVKRYHDGEANKRKGIHQSFELIFAEQLWPEYDHSLACLQAIAFEAIQKKSLSFCLAESNYRNVLQNFQPSQSSSIASFNQAIIKFEGLKLLQDTRGGKSVSNSFKQTYYFVHLSFQEFFAASYIFRQLCSCRQEDREIVVEWLAENKYFLRYRVVIAFLVNLLYLDLQKNLFLLENISGYHVQKDNIISCQLKQAQDLFWNIVLEKKVDIIGLRQMELLLFLGNHMGKAIELMPSYNNLKVLVEEIIDKKLNESGKNLWFIALRNSLQYCQVKTRSRFLSRLVQIFKNRTRESKSELFFVQDFGPAIAIPDILLELEKELDSDNPYTIATVWKAISFLGNAAAVPGILKKLTKSLRNNDNNIHLATFDALMSFGSMAATTEILEELVNVFYTGDSGARKDVYLALKALNCSQETIRRILDDLAKCLHSSEVAQQEMALSYMTNLEDQAETPEILEGLRLCLSSKDLRICKSALWAIRSLKRAAYKNEIVVAITNCLLKEDLYMPEIALESISVLKCCTAETPLIIEKLEEYLCSNVINIQVAALRALGSLDNIKILTEKMLLKLESYLNSIDISVKKAAFEAVANLGDVVASRQKILHTFARCLHIFSACSLASYEIIEIALRALRKLKKLSAVPIIREKLELCLCNDNLNIVVTALLTVAHLGKVIMTPKIITIIASCLKSNDIKVQDAALDVVSALGTSIANLEIIQALFAALSIQAEFTDQIKFFIALRAVGYIEVIKYLSEMSDFNLCLYLKFVLLDKSLLLRENGQKIQLINIDSEQQYELSISDPASAYTMMLDGSKSKAEGYKLLEAATALMITPFQNEKRTRSYDSGNPHNFLAPPMSSHSYIQQAEREVQI